MKILNRYQVAYQALINHAEIFLLKIEENKPFINESIIPKSQMEELKKYRYTIDSEKRILARSFLFEFVHERYGSRDFEFLFNKFNRPDFRFGPKINFSFSYSGDYVFVGVSSYGRIGIDIEFINPQLRMADIADEIMCLKEILRFGSLADNPWAQREYFFRLFSAKESIVKAFGTGLHFPVRKLDLEETDHFVYEEGSFTHHSLGRWMNEYAVSICYEDRV